MNSEEVRMGLTESVTSKNNCIHNTFPYCIWVRNTRFFCARHKTWDLRYDNLIALPLIYMNPEPQHDILVYSEHLMLKQINVDIISQSPFFSAW